MQTQLIINNERITPENFEEIRSPEDNHVIGNLALASREDVNNAYKSAKLAFKSWSKTPAHERMYKLELVAHALLEKKNELAAILSSEIAKPLRDSIKEVERSAEYILFTAQTFRSMEGRVLDGDRMPGFNHHQKTAIVTYEPLGVVLAISPFNYPVNLAVTKLAPALVTGNTVIFKPATSGAISASIMAEIFANIMPEGVFNFISGKSSEIGDYLLTHDDLSMIAFTGSTATGRYIQNLAKVPIYLEMGGKDAAIVLADADIEKAADEIVKGGFSYSAQRCTAVKRVIVEESVADNLVGNILTRIAQLKLGNAIDNADITALIDSKTTTYVMDLIKDAKDKGAEILSGNHNEGNIIHPTLIDKVTKEMKIYFEEPFGPALPIIRVKNMNEAIDIVNSSKYGLQSDVFTKNISDAMFVANNLEVGTVQINGKSDRGPDNFPFPGIKDSGMGVAGLKDSIQSMMRMKVIVINI